MSINTTPPISLKEIQFNFGKDGKVGSDDRYVRDFAQRDDDWDLLDYAGQAYGLQYQFASDKWGAIDDNTPIPLDASDKREAGVYIGLGEQTDIVFGEDDTRGKYAKLSLAQAYYQDNPGAVGLNGFWYASDVGSENRYRVTATIETTNNFPSHGEVWLDIFGYRYGYLDGSRVDYLLFGNGSRPGPNTRQEVDAEFTVNGYYRHIVMNFNLWMAGDYTTGTDYAEMIVSNAKVERI